MSEEATAKPWTHEPPNRELWPAIKKRFPEDSIQAIENFVLNNSTNPTAIAIKKDLDLVEQQVGKKKTLRWLLLWFVVRDFFTFRIWRAAIKKQ